MKFDLMCSSYEEEITCFPAVFLQTVQNFFAIVDMVRVSCLTQNRERNSKQEHGDASQHRYKEVAGQEDGQDGE